MITVLPSKNTEMSQQNKFMFINRNEYSKFFDHKNNAHKSTKQSFFYISKYSHFYLLSNFQKQVKFYLKIQVIIIFHTFGVCLGPQFFNAVERGEPSGDKISNRPAKTSKSRKFLENKPKSFKPVLLIETHVYNVIRKFKSK